MHPGAPARLSLEARRGLGSAPQLAPPRREDPPPAPHRYLGWTIQTGEHSPLEDAVASLRLYQLKRQAWEREGGAAAMTAAEAESGGGGRGGEGGGEARAKPKKPSKPSAGGSSAAASKGIRKPGAKLPASQWPGIMRRNGEFGEEARLAQMEKRDQRKKHKWSRPPGQKAPKSKKGAFAGLLSAHGM